MTALHQCKHVRLYPDEKIRVPDGSSVYSLMKSCASHLHIQPESFQLFRIVQKNSIILPYRKKLPQLVRSNYQLYYRVVDFNFNIEWFCSTDPELLSYLYHQIMYDVISGEIRQDNSAVLDIIALDILRFSMECGQERAYMLYFEMFETLARFEGPACFEAYQGMCKNSAHLSSINCLVQMVEMFSEFIHPNHDQIKRAFQVKIPTKSSMKSKLSEKKFLIKATAEYISVLDEKQFEMQSEKQSETKLTYNKINSINMLDKSSVSIVYNQAASQGPILVTFKGIKDLESFLALVDFYFSLLSPSKLLITKFGDIKIDDSSVQYTRAQVYNLISRNPSISYFFNFEEAKTGLQMILNKTGSYMITSDENIFCLSYSINDKIRGKGVICKDGLYQIVGNELRRFNNINDLVTALKPKIEGSDETRVNLINRVSDALLIDILTTENFQFNIPPMFVDISRPQIYESWIYTVFNCSFEDLSGNKRQCKCIEFSEYMNQKDILEVCTTVARVSSESIIDFIGICKPGRGNRICTLINYPSMMIYLHQFLKEENMNRPVQISSSLKIIQQVAAALMELHSMEIEHGCPAPHHILINPNTLKIKLTDIGITKMLFLKSPQENPYCKPTSLQRNALCSELRWLPGTFLIHPSTSFSLNLDKWVFGCFLWQLFNDGRPPLSEHSDEAVLELYLAIKSQQSNTNDTTRKGLRWFSTKFDIPGQSELKLNKMIQKLVNYIITTYTHDQPNAFSDIVNLFNNYIYQDEGAKLFEELMPNTEINICDSRPDGHMFFETSFIEPMHPRDASEGFDSSDNYEYSDEDNCADQESVYESCVSNYTNYQYSCNVSDEVMNAEQSLVFDHNPLIEAHLLNFEYNKWECSYYTLGKRIGAGNFGVVRKATVEPSQHIKPHLIGQEVAVKIFQLKAINQPDVGASQEDSPESVMEKICKEAKNMSKLQHHHIVPFYGISTTEDLTEVHIIMPFYPFGCLKKYISNYQNELHGDVMTSFGIQIAEGMEYITSQGFVHRDLALRNILVESSVKVRIADLGLTRGVNKDANYYYVLNKSSRNWLPILYYPPEFFTNDFKYDKYGDVWSYGVTCFELWSKGQTPYAAQHITKSVELMEFLKQNTLDIPPDTPDVFEHVMRKCWLPKRERWDFKDIVRYLQKNAHYTVPKDTKQTSVYALPVPL